MFSTGTKPAAKRGTRPGIGRTPGIAPGIVSRLASLLLAERDQWALWLPVGLGLGAALYFALSREPWFWLGALAAAGFGVVFLAARRGASPAALLLALGAAFLAAAGLGFQAASVRAAAVDPHPLRGKLGVVGYSGCVVTVEAGARDKARVLLDQVRLDGLGGREPPRRLRLTLRRLPDGLAPGACIAGRALVDPPPKPAMPGGYDFERRAYFAGIGAYGVGFGVPVYVDRPEDGEGVVIPGGFRPAVERLRQNLSGRIAAAVPGDAGGLATALITGNRAGLSEPAMAAMRDSGLAHLIAISGLHISLVAGLVFFLVRGALALLPLGTPLALRLPAKKIASATALVAALFYLVVSGAAVPTQRAVIMLAVVLLAVALDRDAISMRVIAVAAGLLVLLTPEALVEAGPQMSFAAVVALVAAYETIARRPAPDLGVVRSDVRGDVWGDVRGFGRGRRAWWLRGPALYAGGLVLTTLIATLATSPFAAFHFQRVAALGIVANLVAVPVTGLWIMPWGVAALLLYPFGLEALALGPMALGTAIVIDTASLCAGWPAAALRVAAVPGTLPALFALGGLWFCLWRRPWRWAGAGLVALVLVWWPFASDPPDLVVSGDGRTVLALTPGGAHLSRGRANGFQREIWLRRIAADPARAALFPRPGARSADGAIGCDREGCIVRLGGVAGPPVIAALADTAAALADDCRAADIVVSRLPVRGACPAPVVIDRFDLWRAGAHEVRLGPGGIRVVSVRDVQGDRPWATWPARAARLAGSARRE